MDVSTPPSLDLACPQAKTEIANHDHIFRERGVDKIKYGHESIMIIIIAAIYHHKTSHDQVIIYSQVKV
jgi:hypothetical protein